METESLDLEDGEVVDDDPIDTFGPYKVLQRPLHAATPKIIESNYSDDSDETSDSGSDSDAELTSRKSKRPKIKARKRNSDTDPSKRPDKYKIWCTQVQEESLTADLVSCGVTKKMHQGRSVENYDVPSHFGLNGFNHSNHNSSDDERAVVRRTRKRTHGERHKVLLRLGKREHSMDVDSQRGSERIISELSVTSESTDSEVASDIAKKLNEKKDSLIKRIVSIIGKEKAIEFYKETQKVEQGGGLLIMNGSRRRTPGGVYLYLVKNDEHIPQEKIREIFAVDKKDSVEIRKKSVAAQLQEHANQLLKNLEKNSEKDLPALLTRVELSTQKIAEKARLRRGEGMDINPVDSDRTVSNPPPSPVTDDPDHSEHVAGHRQVQDYSEDFLDIGLDVDSMEMF